MKSTENMLFPARLKQICLISVAVLFLFFQLPHAHADTEKDAAFLKAALTGNLPDVEKMLKEGINVDLQSPEGFTALSVAAQNGHQEVVKLLLNRKAAVDLANVQGGNTFAAGQ